MLFVKKLTVWLIVLCIKNHCLATENYSDSSLVGKVIGVQFGGIHSSISQKSSLYTPGATATNGKRDSYGYRDVGPSVGFFADLGSIYDKLYMGLSGDVQILFIKQKGYNDRKLKEEIQFKQRESYTLAASIGRIISQSLIYFKLGVSYAKQIVTANYESSPIKKCYYLSPGLMVGIGYRFSINNQYSLAVETTHTAYSKKRFNYLGEVLLKSKTQNSQLLFKLGYKL